MSTRSQVLKSTQVQIQIQYKEEEPSKNESFDEGNLDNGNAGKEVVIHDDSEVLKEKQRNLQEFKEELYPA